jgi:hypothetical protein
MYGTLYDYSTGDPIRIATRAELRASLRAAGSGTTGAGTFELDGRTVYVAGECTVLCPRDCEDCHGTLTEDLA